MQVNLHPWLQQRLVDLIVKFWPIMPNYWRAWAFMNDKDLNPGVGTWWRSKNNRPDTNTNH